MPVDVASRPAEHLVSRGLDADPDDIDSPGAFLLGRASDVAERAPGPRTGQGHDPRQGIAATTFRDPIKAFFADGAGQLRGQRDAGDAERFARASRHRMRHSSTSHAIAGGMPIEIAQRNLGRASPATATVDLRTDKRRRTQAGMAFRRR